MGEKTCRIWGVPCRPADHDHLNDNTARAIRETMREYRDRAEAAETELRAARAEVERLRTAAADERADVVAWLMRQGWVIASNAINRGAHVGAAKGANHG